MGRSSSSIHSSKTIAPARLSLHPNLESTFKRTTENIRSCQFSMRKSTEAFSIRSYNETWLKFSWHITSPTEMLLSVQKIVTGFSFCVGKWRKNRGYNYFAVNERFCQMKRRGESWARFNGLHRGNPGMKTETVQTEKRSVGSQLYTLPPRWKWVFLFVCFFSSQKRFNPTWHGVVVGCKNSWSGFTAAQAPFRVTSGRKRKKSFSLTALYQLCFTLPASFAQR